MRVLQIGADRSKRGILYPGMPGYARQDAYAAQFGTLDIIGFSRAEDGAQESSTEHLHVYPTNSSSPLSYGYDAMRIAERLPRPDVVSTQDPFETGLAGYFIAKKLRVPLHVQVHTDFLAPEYAKLSILNSIRVPLAKFVIGQASGIRAVSAWVQNSIVAKHMPKVPVSVLPLFVDRERIRMAQLGQQIADKFAKFAFRVLVVARLEHEKNVALAIHAFEWAAPPEACLIIVGDGSERAALEKRVSESAKLSGRVFFEGQQDSAPYYKLASIVLVPSFYEGYGMVAVEALSAGVPVMSNDVGAARESGAIITTRDAFPNDLEQWFKDGPRTGKLLSYPYASFDEYVKAYCDDIARCIVKV